MAIARKEIKAPRVKKKKKFEGRAISVAQIKLGGEPSLGMFPDKMQLVRTFNWYAQCVEREQRSKFLVAYMHDEGKYTPDQILFADKKGRKFPETWAYVARMLSIGTILDDEVKVRLNAEIAKFLLRDEPELDEDGIPIERPKFSRSSRKLENLPPMIHFIEDLFDKVISGEDPEVNFYEALTRMGCASPDAKLLRDHFDAQMTEYLAMYTERDEQLNEGYAFLRKNSKQRVAMMCVNLKKDLDALINAKKDRVRKQRKKKDVPVAKQIAKLRFQKESIEYKIASIDPSRIIGAKAVFTFNTKTRILTIFEANDDKGISVKRTNILNATGRCKKLRKPEAILPALTSTTRAACLVQFKELTTNEFESNYRTTTETILLRVFQ